MKTLTNFWIILILVIVTSACNPFSSVNKGEADNDDLTVTEDDNAVVMKPYSETDEDNVSNCQISATFTGTPDDFGLWADIPARFRVRFGVTHTFTVRCNGRPSLAVRVEDGTIPDQAISMFRVQFILNNTGGITWVDANPSHEFVTKWVNLTYQGDGTETNVGVICPMFLRVGANPEDHPEDLAPITMEQDGNFWFLFLNRVLPEEVHNCNYRVLRGDVEQWPTENLFGQGEADEQALHLNTGQYYQNGGFTIDWKLDRDGHIVRLGEDLNFGEIDVDPENQRSATETYEEAAIKMNEGLSWTGLN